jgi:hypothetical protein
MAEKLKQDHYKVGICDKEEADQYKQGRGAQYNTKSRYHLSRTGSKNDREPRG